MIEENNSTNSSPKSLEPNKNETIAEAYRKIYGKDPESETEEWRLASDILDNWNVPALGEDLAKETLFRIINHTPFPSEPLTESVVGVAEEKITELFPEMGESDPHMALIAELERRYWAEKEVKEKNETKESGFKKIK